MVPVMKDCVVDFMAVGHIYDNKSTFTSSIVVGEGEE